MEATSEKHPCFNFKAKYKYGRVHLPVAPRCNIQCNFCNRKFDCVNESRPGVTSQLLTPYQAVQYVKKLKQHDGGRISVAGFAGPGDPMAQPEVVLETMRLLKEEFDDLTFCLSTNGLNAPDYLQELHDLGVKHLTVTVNAVSPAVLAEIYSWVRFKKKVYRRLQGGQVLLEQQLESIVRAKELGFIVKINSIVIPEINDWHIPELAADMKRLNVDVMNCIPFYPVEKTPFGELPAPSGKIMSNVRSKVSKHIPLMLHCARCRADAVGLLGKDMPEARGWMKECASLAPGETISTRPYVAAATYEGMLVNRHLGECETLYIYGEKEDGSYELVDKRAAPPAGIGNSRWEIMGDLLKDCRAFLVSGVGPKPNKILNNAGIRVITMNGLIEDGLKSIYKNEKLKTAVPHSKFKCGASCGGDGGGCG